MGRRGLRRYGGVLRSFLALASVAFFVLWLIGCWRYTSLGIDREQLEGELVKISYYRVRWPGDGSIWFGGGRFYLAAAGHVLDPLDPGGVFFLPPRRPVARSWWNKFGFWCIFPERNSLDTAEYVWEAVREYWVGFPGWLPSLFLLLPFLLRKNDRLLFASYVGKK